MRKAIMIDPNTDTVTEVGLRPTLEALQAAVGGKVQALRSESGLTTLWVNEDGKVLRLAPNRVATALWWALDPEAAGWDILHGPVVVTGGVGRDGEDLDVHAEALTALNIPVPGAGHAQ
jgi:hypothetical protein